MLSDGIYFLIYYVVGYRKDVVFKNLTIAFPEKSDEEKIKISKEFYGLFVDTFIETIKLISISKKEFQKLLTEEKITSIERSTIIFYLPFENSERKRPKSPNKS